MLSCMNMDQLRRTTILRCVVDVAVYFCDEAENTGR
jgi:hypothetical protein